MSVKEATSNKPLESPVPPQPTSKKGTAHQGFTYTILLDAETISNALFDTVTQQVKKHLPTFDKGLKVLTAHSTRLSLRNTTYEQRTGNQDKALKELREDLAKYRGAQTTFHNNYQELVVFTREIIVLVKCLKPSQETIHMRAKPSRQETELVTQTKELDKLKTSAYGKAKEGILVDVRSLNKNIYEKLGEFDIQMQKLEKRGRDMEASQKSMLSVEYWWTYPLQVEELATDLADVDETDYDKPDSYEDYLRKTEASSSTTPTPLPTSNISALPPNLRSLAESENSSGKVTTTLKEETSTTSAELPPVSSSSVDTSTTSDPIPLESSSSVDTSTTSNAPTAEITSTIEEELVVWNDEISTDSLSTNTSPSTSKSVNSTTPPVTSPPGLQSNTPKHLGTPNLPDTQGNDQITKTSTRNPPIALRPRITVGRGSTDPKKPKEKN